MWYSTACSIIIYVVSLLSIKSITNFCAYMWKKWMDKYNEYPDNGILFNAKKRQDIKPWKTCGNIKCMLLSERS